jgi:hypothetical protein
MKTIHKHMLIRSAYLFVISVLFLLVYSAATSPITIFSGHDSAFFQIVGQGMTDGLLPYRDFFDMKGPYLFLIQCLGQLIWRGRVGIFIVQVLNLFISLVIIDRILAIPFSSVRRWLVLETLSVFPVLFFTSFTLEYGNLTEEFSLPCILLALWMAQRYFRTPAEEHPVRYAFIYGTACGFLAFMRITNAAFVGAAVLTIVINLIYRRHFKNLLLNAVAFLLGCGVAALPVIILFAAHGELSEMLYQVFKFGFMYSQDDSLSTKLITVFTKYWNCLLVLLFPVAVAILNFKGKRSARNGLNLLLSANGFLFMMVAVTLGNAYLHYFLLGLPNLVLGITLLREGFSTDLAIFKKFSPAKMTAALLLLLVVLNCNHFLTHSAICGTKLLRLGSDARFAEVANDIVDQIPEESRDSVFAYSLPSCSQWYYATKLYPPTRHCDWHHNYTTLSPEIAAELTEWIAQGGPEYIVTTKNFEFYHVFITPAILENYTVVYTNEEYDLYRLNSLTQP